MAGDRPTNPELLEYLATSFQANGMSWKKLAKEIVMSRTYRLSTSSVPANMNKDPDNRFFWRANRQRLEAEGVWDNLLLASEALDLKAVGGPSEEMSEKMTRRAVYAKVSRMYPQDFQATFDVPTATISTEKRYATNVPQQRLFFLNNTFVEKQAEKIAAKLTPLGDESMQVTKAFEMILQRAPTVDELKASTLFLKMPPVKFVPEESAGGEGAAEKAAEKDDKDKDAAPKKLPDSLLRSFCWALLSSNEFLFLD
jgi:hypothetical protein